MANMQTEYKICPKCGKQLKYEAKFCAGCGAVQEQRKAEVSPQKIFCPKCGNELNSQARFCGGCGTAVGMNESVFESEETYVESDDTVTDSAPINDLITEGAEEDISEESIRGREKIEMKSVLQEREPIEITYEMPEVMFGAGINVASYSEGMDNPYVLNGKNPFESIINPTLKPLQKRRKAVFRDNLQEAETERQKQAELERIRQEQEAEAQRQRQAELERIRQEQEAEAQRKRQAELERIRQEQEEEMLRKMQEEAMERLRQEEEERLRREAEERKRQEEEERIRQEQEAEAQRQRQAELERIRQEQEAEAQRQRQEELERIRQEQEAEAQHQRQEELERIRQEQEEKARMQQLSQNICPDCGKELRPGAKFCSGCGKTIEAKPQVKIEQNMGTGSSQNLCPHCGKELRPGAKFCVGCGASVAEKPEATKPEPKKPEGPVCPKCSKPVRPGAKFCPGCGAQLSIVTTSVISSGGNGKGFRSEETEKMAKSKPRGFGRE